MGPLSGLRIAVTRPRAQTEDLAQRLRQAGARVLICPLIAVEPRPLDGESAAVLRSLGELDWLVFTSVNGVEHLARAARELGMDDSWVRRSRIACVGPATADALRCLGREPDLVPDEHTGAAVARSMSEAADLEGATVLLARAAGGAQQLPEELRKQGARVYDWALYRSVPDQHGISLLRRELEHDQVDLVAFTSGSTARYFVEAIGPAKKVAIAAIGPTTAAVARSYGLRVDIEAESHTNAGLVSSIVEYYAARRGISEANNAAK